ncbi:CAP domain-containing protein [Halorussus limi]|uniref:CAP domain-containing protein n=1 Tax=Halorussus limi TaxID=2938695 RepID=A0A8U0HQG1_9EURY|nr:CAP domain-containing protein [Halorussus limi]UPV72976.1 CAP domain-containing protein [Halorussus limi]
MDNGKVRTYGTEEAVENLDSSPPVQTKSDEDLDDELDEIREKQKNSIFDHIINAVVYPFAIGVVLFRWFFSLRALLILILGVATVGQLGLVGVPGFPVDTSPAESAIDDAGGAVANVTDSDANSTNGSSDGGFLSDDELNRTKIEYLVHKEINERRRAHDLRPIQFDKELRQIARYHSKDMGENQYFAHESPSGETMADRYDKFGYDCRVDTSGNQYATGAENIAYTYAYENIARENGETAYYTTEKEIAQGLVNGWMNSTGHRKNILKPYWENEGIGIYIIEIDGKTRVYATQNFC